MIHVVCSVIVVVNELKCMQPKKKKKFMLFINPETVTCDHGANIIKGREA